MLAKSLFFSMALSMSSNVVFPVSRDTPSVEKNGKLVATVVGKIARQEMKFSDAEERRLLELEEREISCRLRNASLFEEIEVKIKEAPAYIKEQFKEIILSLLFQLKEGQKLPICLVDLQTDFILPQSACPVPGAELDFMANVAIFLDAVIELVKDPGNADIQKRVILVISQDAHRIQRAEDVDAGVFRAVYGDKEAAEFFKIEDEELSPVDIANHQWGLHCLVGTYGVGMPKPLSDRVSILTQYFETHRYGKVNYSAAKTGIELSAELGDLSDPVLLRNYQDSLYKKPYMSYAQFFSTLTQAHTIKTALMLGICANYCVQAAAEGLATSIPELQVAVLEPCTYFLLNKSYDEERKDLEESYTRSGVTVIKVPEMHSNPQAISKEYGPSIRIFTENSK